jgi:Na+/melibiose symporter-like transporter
VKGDALQSNSRTHQRNKMKNKGKDKSNDEEILNEFGQEYKKTESINSFQKLFFFFVAQVTTMLPSYLFQGVKNLEFSGMTIILYIVICAIATFFLFYAYQYVFLRSKPVLRTKYQSALKDIPEKQTVEKERLIELGTTGYTLFFTNSLFLAMTLLIGFYTLQTMDARINYIFSMIASSVAMYKLSRIKLPEKQQK